VAVAQIHGSLKRKGASFEPELELELELEFEFEFEKGKIKS
jgi:hypothetical protein